MSLFYPISPTGSVAEHKEHAHRDQPDAARHVSPILRGRPARILLLDDDEIFRQIMRGVAKRQGVELAALSNVTDLATIIHSDYDAAIIDYDLGTTDGITVTNFLSTVMKNLPVVIASQTERAIAKKWPKAIKYFVSKDRGPREVLNSALEAAHNSKDDSVERLADDLVNMQQA